MLYSVRHYTAPFYAFLYTTVALQPSFQFVAQVVGIPSSVKSGRFIVCAEVQPSNACALTTVTAEVRVKDVSLVQPEKTLSPICVTPGIDISVSEVQPRKVLFGSIVRPLPSDTDLRFVQPLNPVKLLAVTVLTPPIPLDTNAGNDMVWKLRQLAKALAPICVTALKSMESRSRLVQSLKLAPPLSNVGLLRSVRVTSEVHPSKVLDGIVVSSFAVVLVKLLL